VHRLKKRKFIVLALVVVAGVSAVAGYAFWTQSGSGSGGATTGTTSSITVNQTSTITGLYLGGPCSGAERELQQPDHEPRARVECCRERHRHIRWRCM
jgi:hypothetical protein